MAAISRSRAAARSATSVRACLPKVLAYWSLECGRIVDDAALGAVSVGRKVALGASLQGYAALTPVQLSRLLTDKDPLEMCHDN